jgi:hypothetical protein
MRRTWVEKSILLPPFIQGWLWWAIAIAYAYLNNFVFKGTFGLMLHCTSHRVFFRKKYGFLNHYLPWVVAPFFGHSPETYFTHHIGMHHAENNLEADESSTMPFQRDSIKDFAIYFGNFLLRGVYDLARYFFYKKKKKTDVPVHSWRAAFYFVLHRHELCQFQGNTLGFYHSLIHLPPGGNDGQNCVSGYFKTGLPSKKKSSKKLRLVISRRRRRFSR